MTLLNEKTKNEGDYVQVDLELNLASKYCYAKDVNYWGCNCLRPYGHSGAHISYLGLTAAASVWYTNS